ncbi:hypothetical protein ACWDTI_16475 [Gordonia sp. NPDC003424]
MDLFDAARACRRRWYVVVPLLLVTIVATGIAYLSATTVYQATAVVGVSPSPITGSEGNGILNNGGTQLLANLTNLGLQEPDVVHRIVTESGAKSFKCEVYAVPGGQLPLVSMTSTADDPQTAIRTLDIATKEATTVLDRVQADAQIPETAFAVVYGVSAQEKATALTPGRSRLTAGLLAVGFFFSVVITILFDVAMMRRKRQNEATHGTDDVGTVGEPVETDEDRDASDLSAAHARADDPDPGHAHEVDDFSRSR